MGIECGRKKGVADVGSGELGWVETSHRKVSKGGFRGPWKEISSKTIRSEAPPPG
jgi:hypothetical protein